MESNLRSEGCLLVGGKREINPSAPEWQTDEAKRKVLARVQKEIDLLILDKKALVPLSTEQSARFPRNPVVPSRLVSVAKFDGETQTTVAQARLTARGDQDPDLLSAVRSNQTSASTVSMAGKMATWCWCITVVS